MTAGSAPEMAGAGCQHDPAFLRLDEALGRLACASISAPDFAALALAAESFVRCHLADARVALWWGRWRPQLQLERLRCAPTNARAFVELEQVALALQTGSRQLHSRLWSWPLPLDGHGFAVLQIDSGVEPELLLAQTANLDQGMAVLARRLCDLLALRRLQRSVRRSRRSVLLQKSLYAISDLASSDLDRAEMLRAVHQIVGTLMYAENFFIALHDRLRRTLRFVYFADVKDYDWPAPDDEFHEDQLAGSLTMEVIHRGQALIGPSYEIVQQLQLDYVAARGPDSEDWLGVPMVSGGEVIGAIVVQSYDKARRYDQSDRALLSYVAQHILTALTRRRAQQELEALVNRRTHELAAANQDLQLEVQERRNAEQLQAALFRIAELTSSAVSMHAFFAAIHAVVGELLNARNFIIVLLGDDRESLEFPYAADEQDSGAVFAPRKLRRGLTEYVLRSAKPLLASREQIDALVAAGEMQTSGSQSVCWLGVPMLQLDQAIGAIVVQSYTPGVGYNLRDQELLTFVAIHIATALQRRRAQESLKLAYAELEGHVEELRRTQTELIEIEKMASLGRLVAGVAHEVNTPLGIGVTAISFLRGQLAAVRAALPAAQVQDLLGPVETAAEMAEIHLHRAANLVKTFKQVAVDQSSSQIRTVNVREYLEGTLLSLHPLLRKSGHQLDLDCAPNIMLTSRPDALHQIMVNLVTNSLAHGYPDGRVGQLRIAVIDAGPRLQIRYQDDGVGMDEKVASHMFEPFYTTRRGRGGTGLGLHIVYNLVTQALAGKISCETSPGAGVRIDMLIPGLNPRGSSPLLV
jgi:signal transduction histidine kinase